MRRILRSRQIFEKASPCERFSRTSSPSSTTPLEPADSSLPASVVAIVDFPAPDKPVSQMVTPGCASMADSTPFDLMRFVLVSLALSVILATILSSVLQFDGGSRKARNKKGRSFR